MSLVQNLGLTDAVALDGGGSVSLIYEGAWKVSTTRQIKNVIGLYVKAKSDPGGGEPPALSYRVSDGYVPPFAGDMDHMLDVNGSMVRIKEVLVKSNGILVPVNEIRKETG